MYVCSLYAMEMASKQPAEETDDTKSFFVNSEGLKVFCKYWYPQLSDAEGLR